MNTLEVSCNGRILFSLLSDISLDDIAIVSRAILSRANLDVHGFDELINATHKTSRTLEEAYGKAEEVHRTVFGHDKYKSFDSYYISRLERLKALK